MWIEEASLLWDICIPHTLIQEALTRRNNRSFRPRKHQFDYLTLLECDTAPTLTDLAPLPSPQHCNYSLHP